MDSIYKLSLTLGRRLLGICIALLSLSGCSVSYKFNGGTIDYTQIRSITIQDVTNRAAIIYPTLASNFTERLKDIYTSRTHLEQVPRGGDLELECVITGYDLSTMSVSQDNFAEQTAFTVTVQVKYTNNVNTKESFDNKSFKAHRSFDRGRSFAEVQDQLLEEILDELIKQIFNETVENW